MATEEGEFMRDRSLAETPNWAVATVICVMLASGFFFHISLKRFGKWLDRTKRKSLLQALGKIKEELMLFGLLSLLMGHWAIFVAKICVKSSVMSERFYPCVQKDAFISHEAFHYLNMSRERVEVRHDYCPEGKESFASYESLEQLHRFLFVLGITHVSYSFFAIALAMTKIYSWRTWEYQAKTMAVQGLLGPQETALKMSRLTTFVGHHTSHSWSSHKVLVWLLCFSRQFWTSIHRSDYMALRLGFITTHELHLSYDFHNYMLRSMEEEFRDIVGISVPLWIYVIVFIFLDFHGTNVYFWISFLPAILILVIGTKLHRVVVKLAVEITDICPKTGHRRIKLRDELFWFGKPRLLLWLIQFISFQNAFEMATFLWSLWEIKGPSCFMKNINSLVIRLVFGVVSQFWCSFITFPLYVIVTQMGSKFKKTVISENIRRSLHGWRMKVKAKRINRLSNATQESDIPPRASLDSADVVETDKTGHVARKGDPSRPFKEDTNSSANPQKSLSGPIYDTYEEDTNTNSHQLNLDHIYDSHEDDEKIKHVRNRRLSHGTQL